MNQQATLAIRDLARTYQVPVIAGLTIQVQQGSFTCIIGPNGCGKSTLLRLLAGLEAPDAGEIWLAGSPLQEALRTGHRVGMVFQEPRLLPWRSLRDNVTLPLRAGKRERADVRDRAVRYLDLVGLGPFADYLPGRVSGGMQQRASIARALASDPDLLIMDEPFSALDAQNRRLMQDELARIWEQTACTVLFVTHSISEAIRLGTDIVMLKGRPTSARLQVSSRDKDLSDLEEELLAILTEEVQTQDGAPGGQQPPASPSHSGRPS